MMHLLRAMGAFFPFFLFAPPMLSNDRTRDPVTSPNACPSAFLERASDAFSSRPSRPDSRATSVAV